MAAEQTWQRGPVEWPTLAVAAAVYVGFGLVTWFHAALPWWLLALAGGYLVAWHGSLQHEVVHGHPTRSRALNHALVAPAIGLWLPFEMYRVDHLAHHRAEILGHPAHDPESYYADPASRRGRAGEIVARAHNTLAGRLAIGPPLLVARSFADSARRVAAGETWVLRAWLVHLAGCAAVLGWVVGACGMSPWLYLATFVYPGIALTLLRSFAEHEASERPEGRTAVVETALPLGLVFLHNNLHVVHHAEPTLPWYAIPARWATIREATRAAGPHLVHDGYLGLARRFAFRPKEPVDYPLSA